MARKKIPGKYWVLCIFFLIAIIIFMVTYIIPSYQCNQKLLAWNPEDRENAEKIITACDKAINLPFSPCKIEALKNAGRASLVTWNPEWDDKNQEDKKDLIKQTKQYFQQAYDENSEDPQAAFYLDFMADFETVVVRRKNCEPAILRYNEQPGTIPPNPIVGDQSGTIDLYLDDEYTIKPSDFSLLKELSDWLINRNTGSNQSKSREKATDILDLFERNSKKPDQY